MKNIFSYLMLREILIWQHSTDLISYELVLKAAGVGDLAMSPGDCQSCGGIWGAL
jgi:hypothetical protein